MGDFEKYDFTRFKEMIRDIDSPSILEIGSREVTGESLRTLLDIEDCDYKYCGFDIHDGPNVDVIGDAHSLGKFFAKNSFDVIMSKSVFEHIAMPWKVILEINGVLKEGGLLYVNTLLCFPLHELPWDFWRYSNQAWKVLLNKWTGFEILGTEMNIPCAITPSDRHPKWNADDWTSFVNSNVLAKKTSGYDSERLKWDLCADDILSDIYPPESGFRP
jgi:SAM-dependent methyltransferase